MSERSREYIYSRYSQFAGTVAANALGVLTENIKTLHGLSNGSPVYYNFKQNTIIDYFQNTYIQDNTDNTLVAQVYP